MNIIVSGASKGIGRETVKILVQKGNHRIVAIARSEEKLKELQLECEKLNPKARVIPVFLDITHDNLTEVLNPVIAKLNDPIDILLNIAGGLINKPFIDLTTKDFEYLFDVNVKSIFNLVRLLYPQFIKGAHIVNIGSMGGYQGSAKFPGLSLYSASKGAVAILTETMAEEFKDDEISVNCLAIGAVQTEMLEAAFPGYQAPLTSGEMASFIVDFAMNGKKYFNGKVLPVSTSTP